MKKIIAVLLLALLMPITFADMEGTFNVWTDGDASFWLNCYAEGNCNYWIDGTGYSDEKTSGGGFNVWDMTRHLERTISCFLGEKKFCSEWNFRIFNALARVFVLQENAYPVYDSFDIRLLGLERAVEQIDSDKFCNGRISVLLEREDMNWIMCGDIKYVKVNGKAVTVTNATIT